MRRLKTEMVCSCAPHILLGKRIVARVVSKARIWDDDFMRAVAQLAQGLVGNWAQAKTMMERMLTEGCVD